MATRATRGTRLYHFGGFVLDPRAGELRRGESLVHLQEQPLRILLMLLERPGEVVLREDIRKRLWPNGTIVEVGHGINAAVLRLREALGESAGNPRYIETVARRGYRFRDAEASTEPRPARESAAESGSATGSARYRVLEPLGAGGMGVVYRAEDLQLRRQVALKVLAPELAGQPDALGRFEREARAASALVHPNICAIYGIDEHEGRPAIAMELLEGQTLEAALAKGALPRAEALRVAAQAAAALASAHSRGVSHRDLKPSNILLTPAGVKIVDFGLARQEPAFGLEERVTERGAILGTLHYMSPEQAQAKEAGPPSDVFSLGVVIYEMFTGRRPFEGDNSAAVMASVLKSEPPPLASRSVWRLVRQCLNKEPAARPTAAKVEEELRKIPDRVLAFPSPRTLLIPAAAVVVLLAFLLWRAAPSPPRRFVIPNATQLSLSPDGGRLAYRQNGVLTVQELATGETRLIEPAISAPMNRAFWSPDGRSLAYYGAGEMKIVNLESGAARALAHVDTRLPGAWSADGTILIGLLNDGLYRIAAAGGALARITTVERGKGETRHMMPQFFPGERRFLFTAGGAAPGQSMIWTASLDGGERTPLLQAGSNAEFVPAGRRGSAGYLVYVRNRALVAAPFDSASLRLTGGPVEIAGGVASVPTIGSAAEAADFSVTRDALAWRTGATATVELNWMRSLRR